MVDEDLGRYLLFPWYCGNSTKPSGVLGKLQHLTSRQERLDAAAEYAILDNIKGDNTDQTRLPPPRLR